MFDKIKNYILVFLLLAISFAGGYVLAGGLGKSRMSDETCDSIEKQVRGMAGGAMMLGGGGNSNDKGAEKLKELSDMFVKNCAHKKADIKKSADKKTEPLPEKTCAAVEALLEDRIRDEFIERDNNPQNRIGKAFVYANIYANGCPENREKYKALTLREVELGVALGIGADIDIIGVYKRLGMMGDAAALAEKLIVQCGINSNCIDDVKTYLNNPVF